MHSSPRPSPGAGRRPPPAPGGRSRGSLAFWISLGLLGWSLFFPAAPCPGCGGCALYKERLRQAANTRDPGRAAAIIATAEADDDGMCRRGRITPAQSLLLAAEAAIWKASHHAYFR